MVFNTQFSAPGSFVTDSDQFAPPTFGGALAVKYATVTFEDTDSKYLFTLPTGAVLIAIVTDVSVVFNDSGTDLLNIGDGTTADRFVDDLSVATAGALISGRVAAATFADPLEENTPVYGIYTGQNSNADAGVARVAFVYMIG